MSTTNLKFYLGMLCIAVDAYLFSTGNHEGAFAGLAIYAVVLICYGYKTDMLWEESRKVDDEFVARLLKVTEELEGKMKDKQNE